MNRLADSDSSYLIRAADEPIDWYPWSEEAFEKARREEKPVLLSIGAVWCHWCHVMARETWKDPETAAYINENFIAVKVDRDDRPEIDRLYQGAVQALTGQGGWPLTVFLTPDREAFYGGTYFPGKAQRGLPAFKDVLQAIGDMYSKDRGSIERIVNEVSRSFVYVSPVRTTIDTNYPDTVTGDMMGSLDRTNGGFGTEPKFPYAEALLFLLQRYEAAGDQKAKVITDLTLRHMALGGVYDQIGGGFHRYSTDAKWRIPHFEKMLNDNALLLRAYLEAYRLYGTPFYRQVSEEIISFVFRDLVRQPAGFASSIDADVHGEEGAYFTWTEPELIDLLGQDQAYEFMNAYNVTRGGNAGYGNNVLYLIDEKNKASFDGQRATLLKAREKREKPYLDMSIHTSWTAMMVTALARATSVLGDRKCLDYAVKTIDFILRDMMKDGVLYRTYTDRPVIDGYLEDYSCLIEALLETYEVTQNKNYLDHAERILGICDEKFFDSEKGGYYFVQSKDRTPIMQDKPVMDFSTPGSNPQMAINLLKLYYITDNQDYMERAKALVEGFFEMCKAYPLGHGTFFGAMDWLVNAPDVIAVVGPEKEGRELVDLVNSRLMKKIVLLDYGQYTVRPDIFAGKSAGEGKPTAYFCRERKCTMPLTDRQDILEMLKRPRFP